MILRTGSAMKISFEDIPDTGLSLDLCEKGEAIEKLSGGLDFSFSAPVEAHLEITRTEDGAYVSGEVRTILRLACGRCLNEFALEIDTRLSLYYSRHHETAKEKELTSSDMEVDYLEVPELDTSEILLSQISIEAPMKPLCREGCKGLCPECGADLNERPCSCKAEEEPDSRFAALKDFKVE